MDWQLAFIIALVLSVLFGALGGLMHWVVPELPKPDRVSLLRRFVAGCIVGAFLGIIPFYKLLVVLETVNPDILTLAGLVLTAFGLIPAGYGAIDYLKSKLQGVTASWLKNAPSLPPPITAKEVLANVKK